MSSACDMDGVLAPLDIIALIFDKKKKKKRNGFNEFILVFYFVPPIEHSRRHLIYCYFTIFRLLFARYVLYH